MSRVYYKCLKCRHKLIVDIDVDKNTAVAYCKACNVKHQTDFKNLRLPTKEMMLIAVIEYRENVVYNLFTNETL